MNDFYDPKMQGLLTLAAGLLAQSGWQPQRVNVGEALGRAGLPALQAVQQARRYQDEREENQTMRDFRQRQMEKIAEDMRRQQLGEQQMGMLTNLVGGLNQADLSAYGGPGLQQPAQQPFQQQPVPFQQQMEQNLLGPFANTGQDLLYQQQPDGRMAARDKTVDVVGKEPWVILNAQADFLEEKSSGITDATVQQRSQQLVKALRDRADRLETRAGKKKDPVLQQKIQALIESGVSEKQAKGIAAGRYAVSVNPISGERQVIDIATGRPIGGAVGVQQPEFSGTAVSPDIKAPLGTGASGFFGNIANKIKDALGLPMGQPKVQEAINALDNLNVQTTSLLQAAVPGRPSVALMNRLKVLTVEPRSLLQADQGAKSRLKQTRDMLNIEINRMERDILGRANLFRPDQVTETRLNHSQLKQLLREYDQILQSFEPEVRGLGKRDEGTRSPLQFENPAEEELYQKWLKEQGQ